MPAAKNKQRGRGAVVKIKLQLPSIENFDLERVNNVYFTYTQK